MIEAFIIAWNEEEIIELTLKYYEAICDKITVYDNYSTDRTAEIVESRGHKVIRFGTNELNDKEYLKVKNNCYKRSEADLVIVVDCDEILWHRDLKTLLQGGNWFNTIGWNVYSEDMPKESFLEIMTGVYSKEYSKNVCFSPDVDINYVYGCHENNVSGKLKTCSEPLYLLHYRNIGGYDRLKERHRIYRERLSAFNKNWKLGHHYWEDEKEKEDYWYKQYNNRLDVNFYNHNGLEEPFL